MSILKNPGETILKDPNSTEPYGFDWSAYLEELGASVEISSSTWIITGPDVILEAEDDSIVSGALSTQAFLTGGTAGGTYVVTNRITTNTSPIVTSDRSFKVFVEQM